MAAKKYNVGDRFNSWTLLKVLPSSNGNRFWRVVCDCGIIKDTYAANISTGKSRQCGSCGATKREERWRGKFA